MTTQTSGQAMEGLGEVDTKATQSCLSQVPVPSLLLLSAPSMPSSAVAIGLQPNLRLVHRSGVMCSGSQKTCVGV